MNIMLAANSAKRKAAQVHLDAVKARFNARIQQVKAERIIEMADKNSVTALKQTDLTSALANAMAAREESKRKLAELREKQVMLHRASLVNWSAKLAKFQNDSTELEGIKMSSN